MGFWQTSMNQDGRTSTSDAETVSFNLSKSNYLSEVKLRISETNGATGNGDTTAVGMQTVVDAITRIEILGNGSDIKNYRGYECIKWAHYLRRTKTAYNRTGKGAAVQFQDFPMFFGRFFGDEVAILPARLFKTLVLKYTTSFPISATAGFATGTTVADLVEVELVDAAKDPKKVVILKETETETFTAATSGDRKSPASGLPLGNKITKVLVHSYLAGHDTDGITYLKVGINNYAEVPFGKINWRDLADMNRYQRGLEEDSLDMQVYMDDADTGSCRMSNIKSLTMTSNVSGPHMPAASWSGDTLTYVLSDLATPSAVSSAELSSLHVVSSDGIAYTVVLDLDPQDNWAAGIDATAATGVNEVELLLTQAVAHVVYISTQEAFSPA